MRRLGLTTALAATAASVALLGSAASAGAATSTVPFTTCADARAFGCGHVVVPLDPSGAIPGTITLTVRRKLAATGTATEAVVALAGGPGQAALPLATSDSQVLASALNTRDLVVFDQRGTGDSGALKCSALNRPNAKLRTAIPDCAAQIGAARGLYTTDDSVSDIEQIRRALGYTKLVLFGVSYGTKVALRYAAEYPQNVAGLVLDSTVPPNGPDVFDQATYQAVPRILGEICAAGACPGIPDPLDDLRTLLGRLGRHPVRATFFTGSGKPTHLEIGPGDIDQVLFYGDDDPVLRSDFPAAIHAAARGHYGLLAILVDHTRGNGAIESNAVDDPLYYDTWCEELPWPWNRADSPAQRKAQALAALEAMPAGTFGPFSARSAYENSVAPVCQYWPFANAAPEPAITSLPNVPTLIISGQNDLRTPTSNAQAVQALIPDATLVSVPQVGHSVLGTEPGRCAQDAVDAFFAGTPIRTTCTLRRLPGYLAPARAAPTSLNTVVPVGGSRGAAGRTAGAVELTLEWTARELAASLFDTLFGNYDPAYNRGLGGLAGGYAKVSTSQTTQRVTISFHSFSFIGGVTVSGSFAAGIGRLEVSGSRAARGTLVSTRPNVFTGTLGGVHVHFTIKNPNTTALTASVAR